MAYKGIIYLAKLPTYKLTTLQNPFPTWLGEEGYGVEKLLGEEG